MSSAARWLLICPRRVPPSKSGRESAAPMLQVGFGYPALTADVALSELCPVRTGRNEYQVFRRLRLATWRFFFAASDVRSLIDGVHGAARAERLLREPVDVHLVGDPGLLRNPERQAESFARLAEGLVAVDERGARVGRVLLGADDVECRRRPEGLLAPRELELLERHPETAPVDLRAPLPGDHRDDLVCEAEIERAPGVAHRHPVRVFHELVDADLIELLHVDDVLGEGERSGERVRDRDDVRGHGSDRGLGVRARYELMRERGVGAARRGGAPPCTAAERREVLGEGHDRLPLGLEHLVERGLQVGRARAKELFGLRPRRDDPLRRGDGREHRVVYRGRRWECELAAARQAGRRRSGRWRGNLGEAGAREQQEDDCDGKRISHAPSLPWGSDATLALPTS